MNKLTLIFSAFVCLVIFQPSLSAKSKKKNPFSSYFIRIERNEKKLKKEESASKKDGKKIDKLKETIKKDKAKLDKAVEAKRGEIEKKIEKLDDRLLREEEAEKDTTQTRKQLHELNYALTEIDAWEEQKDPPEMEEFKAEPDPEPEPVKKQEPVKKAPPKKTPPKKTPPKPQPKKNEFNADAFRKRMDKEHK